MANVLFVALYHAFCLVLKLLALFGAFYLSLNQLVLCICYEAAFWQFLNLAIVFTIYSLVAVFDY